SSSQNDDNSSIDDNQSHRFGPGDILHHQTARKLFIPSPAAKAKGNLATTPKRIVITPATRPVTAVSCAKSRLPPSTSAEPPRISGLSTTIYAIATNATMPPRISCLIE